MKVTARASAPVEPRQRGNGEPRLDEGGFARFLKESSVRVVIEERSRSVVHESQVAHLVALLNRPELSDLNTSPLIEVLKRVTDGDVAVRAAAHGEAKPHLAGLEAKDGEVFVDGGVSDGGAQLAGLDAGLDAGLEASPRASEEEREREDAPRDPPAANTPHTAVAAAVPRLDPSPGADPGVPVLLGPLEARESVQQALAVIDDPASWATLDKNAALMVVDGLHIRLTTHDGAAAVTVEGKGHDGLIARAEELREVMGQSGIELQRLTAPGANADAQLDRRGAAVVDVNDDFDAGADGFFDVADINVTA